MLLLGRKLYTLSIEHGQIPKTLTQGQIDGPLLSIDGCISLVDSTFVDLAFNCNGFILIRDLDQPCSLESALRSCSIKAVIWAE